MNVGALGFSAGLLQQFTLAGQAEKQQLEQGKQEIETNKQKEQLNALILQQKQFEFQNEKAKQAAIIQGYQTAQQSINNPIDSSGNLSSGNTDPLGLSPEIRNAVKVQYSIGNQLQKIGDPSYMEYYKKAEDLKKQGLSEAQAAQKLQKDKIAEAAQKLNGVKDQASENAMILEMFQQRQDPGQFGLTGNWEQDQAKIARIRDKVMTVHEKNMEDERIKNENLAREREDRLQKHNDFMEKRMTSMDAWRRETKNGAGTTAKPMTESQKASLELRYRAQADKSYKEYNVAWKKKAAALAAAETTEEKQKIVDSMDKLTEGYREDLAKTSSQAQSHGVSGIVERGAHSTPEITPSKFTPEQESWISRAQAANPGMSREEIIQEGKKRKKL